VKKILPSKPLNFPANPDATPENVNTLYPPLTFSVQKMRG